MHPLTRRAVSEGTHGPTPAAPEETTMFQKGQHGHARGLKTLEKQQTLVCILSLTRQESMQYILSIVPSGLDRRQRRFRGWAWVRCWHQNRLFRYMGTRNFPVTGVSHTGAEVQNANPTICQLYHNKTVAGVGGNANPPSGTLFLECDLLEEAPFTPQVGSAWTYQHFYQDSVFWSI